MTKHNAANERIKREYFHYLKEACRRGDASVDSAAKALSRFEEATRWRDFARFHREQAVVFKSTLAELTNAKGTGRLSWSTVQSTVRELRTFFIWLAGQPGYKTKLRYGDADYFNLSEKELAVARAKREKPVPTLEQMHHVLASMPTAIETQRRSRAIVAFALLTGARADALASFRLKHIDLGAGAVVHDAREVRSKFAKTFSTTFFPVGEDVREIVVDWIEWLRRERHFGDDDPLFPASVSGLGTDGEFHVVGLSRKGWQSTQPIRDAFKEGCAAAVLPYFNPHSMRDMLARLGERLCKSPEEFKAWSQNLGHNQVVTTLTSYGSVPPHRQAELIRRMGKRSDDTDALSQADTKQLLAALSKKLTDEVPL